jgi:hypothetical protein
MIIDNNELAKKAMDYFREKDSITGHKLLKEFLDNVKNSGQDHCSCINVKCRYHGKCIDCVILHRGHNDHLPNCFHDMINDRINSISCLTEHSFKNYEKK